MPPTPPRAHLLFLLLLLTLITGFTTLILPHPDFHIIPTIICTQIPLPPTLSTLTSCKSIIQASETLMKIKTGQSRSECIFCRIVDNVEQSRRVYEDEGYIAFHDVSPSAIVHLLVIPKMHVGTVRNLSVEDRGMVVRMKEIGHELLKERGFGEGDRRLGFHVPPFTSVGHLHLHVIGLPFRNWFRSLKYPLWGWARWYVGVDQVESSLERAQRRGETGTWNWSWSKNQVGFI
ncbi:hypothetical protein SpCBS45565_g08271 [Spizellomyces sp. 'palustris']|nr:hypothetical protein SpCBS45565_g08271 [Spizellomyces sp. 'palustris']